jgi:hypothetical protein
LKTQSDREERERARQTERSRGTKRDRRTDFDYCCCFQREGV